MMLHAALTFVINGATKAPSPLPSGEVILTRVPAIKWGEWSNCAWTGQGYKRHRDSESRDGVEEKQTQDCDLCLANPNEEWREWSKCASDEKGVYKRHRESHTGTVKECTPGKNRRRGVCKDATHFETQTEKCEFTQRTNTNTAHPQDQSVTDDMWGQWSTCAETDNNGYERSREYHSSEGSCTEEKIDKNGNITEPAICVTAFGVSTQTEKCEFTQRTNTNTATTPKDESWGEWSKCTGTEDKGYERRRSDTRSRREQVQKCLECSGTPGEVPTYTTCWENAGSDITWGSLDFLEKIKSAKKCQAACQGHITNECKKFFYSEFHEYCYLEKVDKAILADEHELGLYVAGHKTCTRESGGQEHPFLRVDPKKEHPGTEEAEHFLLTCLARARTMFYNFLQGLDSWLEGDLL
jgi:hypothetical protein